MQTSGSSTLLVFREILFSNMMTNPTATIGICHWNEIYLDALKSLLQSTSEKYQIIYECENWNNCIYDMLENPPDILFISFRSMDDTDYILRMYENTFPEMKIIVLLFNDYRTYFKDKYERVTFYLADYPITDLSKIVSL